MAAAEAARDTLAAETEDLRQQLAVAQKALEASTARVSSSTLIGSPA